MSQPFKGVIKLDVRDSKADWGPYEQPKALSRPTQRPSPDSVNFPAGDNVSQEYKTPSEFKGGTILGVGVSVGKDQYLDLEQRAAAALAVE